MYEELEKANIKEENEMLKEIDKNYQEIEIPEIEPKYDDEGNITNEKEIKDKLLAFAPLIYVLWNKNRAAMTNKSKKVILNTTLFYSLLKTHLNNLKLDISVDELPMSKRMITKTKWTKIINDIIEKRSKQIKINTVINGNVKMLNKRIQQTVATMYKQGKDKKQIAKELERTFRYNKNKAKSIALTEINYYKSEAQLEATKGLDIKKIWIHNRAKDPRETHQKADGQVVIGRDNYFKVGDYKTKAPQHFGIPSEDINCHCTMRVELIDEVKVSKEEIREAIK